MGPGGSRAFQNVETAYSHSESLLGGIGSVRVTRHHPIVKKKPGLKLRNMRAVPTSESRCCVCRSKARSRIPLTAFKSFCCETKVWLPPNNRICPHHILNGKFTDHARHQLIQASTKGTVVKEKDMLLAFDVLVDDKPQQQMDVAKMQTDYEYELFFGVSKFEFEEIFSSIKSHIRTSIYRSPRNTLGIFLCKLRLDWSQKLLGKMFAVPQLTVCKIIHQIARLLEDHFVPLHLGFAHISREEILKNHDSEYMRQLYNVEEGCVTAFLDGTYFKVEKSKNHFMQKLTFSSQKGYNLVKGMMTVLPSGRILDVSGPYYSDGKNNDAAILRHMFTRLENGIDQFTVPGDNFMVDRGFRDVMEFLEDKGIQVNSPLLLQKLENRARRYVPNVDNSTIKVVIKKMTLKSGKEVWKSNLVDNTTTVSRKKNILQFSTVAANTSRKVTMTRYIVEQANGRLKNVFKFFENTIQCQYINRDCNKKMGRFLRIACAIINRFRPPLFWDKEKHLRYLEAANRRMNLENTLMKQVQEEDLDSKRACWEKLSGFTEVLDFPKLSIEDLENITLGEYQINCAQGYIDEHIRADSHCTVFSHTSKCNLIKVKLESRFRSSVQHNLWVDYSGNSPGDIRYYCECQVGARTLGCCSHVASVIWFLGYKRHVTPTYKPPLYGKTILDCAGRLGRTEGYGTDDEEDEDSSEEEDQLPVH